MTKNIDYDSPRRPVGEFEEDSPEELKVRATAARTPGGEPDEAENFELPDADLSGEELTVAVVPMQSDEFRCARCFLVHHRNQLAMRRDGEDICQECA